jgi:hypothetical protein
MAVDEDSAGDVLNISIEVFVKDGCVIEVRQDGKQIRAIVNDYDIDFPCVANNVRKDEDGEFYMEQLV